MKKKQAVDMKVTTGTVEEFFQRTREIARKIDKGERLTPEFTLTFEDPADLMRVLSTERVRIIQCLRRKSVPISELASILNRDRKGVSNDVKLLESFGLLKTVDTPNPGHGKMKVVEVLAAKYQLTATI
jgi:predicted transcriptional regulator